MIQIVKIQLDRGYGNGLWQVASEDHEHYNLHPVVPDPKLPYTLHLYKAHCYVDAECTKKRMELMRKVDPQAIGKILKRRK